MTDNEIIKSLECCHDLSNCGDCQYGKYRTKNGLCVDMLQRDARDLINRQKAELENLKEQLADARYLNTVAADDAIKEFADKLKDKIQKSIDSYMNNCSNGYVLAEDVPLEIDCLVEEMVGDTE